MRFSCSVVCYKNKPEQLARVLQSVVSSSLGDVALYVVDNSPHSRLEDVARRFGATYLPRPDNPGFGAAHNMALRDAIAQGSQYHLVLNPDISFSHDVIPVLLAYMDDHRDIGLMMPNVCYPDGRRQYLCKLLPNPVDLVLRRFLPTLYHLTGRRERYELHDSGYDKIMDVPALSGCFMLMRIDTLRTTGMFDERYFMYLEDVDLSRRIGRVARTVYFPHVSVTHEYGKGSYRSSRLLIQHIRSAVRYFNKWGWLSDREKEAMNRAAIHKLRGTGS